MHTQRLLPTFKLPPASVLITAPPGQSLHAEATVMCLPAIITLITVN
jgi:hypothetical protein